MFRVNTFDKLLDKATSNLRLDPDWPTILQICDLIRQNDCTPKYAVAAVKKKLYSQNPHQAMFALLTLESMVKNCGSGVHDEVGSKVFCESLRDLVKTTQHENLRSKILDLIQAWAFAFRNSSKYRAVQDTVNILKTEGYKFPPLKESDAMFSADTAPEWAEGEVCHRCRVAFSLMVRRHHCRACGQVFCQQCSSKTSTLPKFGIEKEVRVCDACYDKVSRPPTSSAKLDIIDTSSDYGPAVTPQKRPGKTEEELREEEELQLALALSQSEAEQKEKERRTRTHIAPEPAPHHTISPTPSSVSASPDHSSNANAELSRYLDRSYWEQRLSRDTTAPTAPASNSTSEAAETDFAKAATSKSQDDDNEDKEIDEFVESLKSQVEIFVNRMKSNSSRGRSIANDTSVQTLFMNITAMHSRLLRYIQQQDDKRVYLESLQDKVNQVRDSRAALDTLRAEHAARLAAQAEAAERQRQMQMAAKLQAMRKKKHEYLQYQRQLALQRVQEQEHEMQMRQEQQKHQYMMANNYYLPGVSMHQFQPGFPSQPIYANAQFHPQMMPQATSEGAVPMPGQPQMSQANMQMGVNQMGALSQSMPQLNNSFAMSTSGMALTQPTINTQSPMTQNMRAALSQQLPMQQQMLLQQMQQMRMPSQAAMHQLMTQNGLPGQTLPQNPSGQQLAKQNLANQPQQQQSAMMPPLTSAQQSMGQPMMISSNPGFGVHMQNMRMPMMQGNQPSNQQVSGYPMNMPNQQNTQPTSQPNIQQSTQMGIQGQQITLPGQQITLPGQHITLPGQQIITSQSNQLPGQQGMHVPNQMPVSQSMPLQGSQVPQPQQHMQSQSQAAVGQLPGQQMQPPGQQMGMPGQQILNQTPNIPQGQQVMNNQIPQAQMPGQAQQQLQMPNQMGPGMTHSVTQPSQMPQQMPPQGPQVSQGQHISQGQQMPHGQQMPQSQPMPQGQQMTQGQQMPQAQQTPQGQQMPPNQSISQGQQMPQGQAMPQNMQPGKIQSQNFGNGPPAQGGQSNQQPQTPVKSKANSTAELITFD